MSTFANVDTDFITYTNNNNNHSDGNDQPKQNIVNKGKLLNKFACLFTFSISVTLKKKFLNWIEIDSSFST